MSPKKCDLPVTTIGHMSGSMRCGQNEENLMRTFLESLMLALPLKISTSKLLIVAFYRTWQVAHNTNNQDDNNDTFELHSPPFPLMTKETM